MTIFFRVTQKKDAFARQSLGDPSGRQLRSWGTDLPALASSSSQRASVPLHKPAVTPASVSRSASVEAIPTTTRPDGTAYQPIEWATVVIAAKVHGDASVSSPTLRFCQPGRHCIAGRQPAKRLGPNHRSRIRRERLGLRAISRASRWSDRYSNRNGDDRQQAGSRANRGRCKKAHRSVFYVVALRSATGTKRTSRWTLLMSAIGTKRTSRQPEQRSASIADICGHRALEVWYIL